MAILEMKVPSPGESITEVEIAEWLFKDGDWVEKDQTIAEIESDKATLELPAEESGILTIKADAGSIIEVGNVICLIDMDAEKPAQPEVKTVEPTVETIEEEKVIVKDKGKAQADIAATPVAKKMMEQHGLNADQLKPTGSNGKIVKQDVLNALSAGIDASAISSWGGSREKRTEKMSLLRRKLSQRLVAVKNETAMLTTFNEVNMEPIIEVRTKYKEIFKEKYGVGLGFMSFFTKAVTEALNLFPTVNAQIDGEQIIFHDYADIGIAVSSPKGLMVPVIRNAEGMSLFEIEAQIKDLATKARNGKISIDEMTGGTFTITNGGVFGSMLSTPILNPPQSAILGMHNIVERPMAVDGKVKILPIMYVALSYDHRIIDGKESVGFLVKVKEMLENPERMIFGSKDPMEVLLGL